MTRRFLQEGGNSRAVIMGTWKYNDPRLGHDIPAVRNSFNRFAELLTGPLCGWPTASIIPVANELNQGRVPDLLMTQFAAATDVALFYYVGHGLLSDDEDVQLCLGLTGTVTEPHRVVSTSLKYPDVRRALLRSPARIKVVILDCCNSRIALPPSLGQEELLEDTGIEGTYVLVAAARKYAHYEQESAAKLPQTFFTKYLADLVKRGINDGPPELTMEMLFRRLKFSMKMGGHSLPAAHGDSGGDYPFCRNAARLPAGDRYLGSDLGINPAELLDLMEEWSQLLIRPPVQARQQIDAARRAYGRGHLVVAGPEGAGKSTLINAMLQADAAPTSQYDAGTVAPVYFLHAASDSPRYRVFYRSDEGKPQASEVSREEFEQWLLQRNNPDNERGVLRGEVMLNHRLLRDGLRLVDMPGTGGTSARVAAETREYLAGTAFTAVLVNQGDRMHALPSVCEELQRNQRDVRIAALIINEHAEGNVASDTHMHLEMLRQAFSQSLLPRLPPGGLGLQESSIYALHLQSLADGRYISPEHDQQWQAYLDAVTRHVRDRGLAASLRACRKALETLDTALAARSARLEDLRVGRISRPDRSALVEQARDIAGQGIYSLKRSEVATRPKHWAKVAAVAEQQRERLTQLLDENERTVTAEPNLSKDRGKLIEKRLNEALTTANAQIAKATEETAGELSAELSQACSDIFTVYAAVLPVPDLPPPATIAAAPSFPETGKYRFDSLAQQIDERRPKNTGLQGEGLAYLLEAIFTTAAFYTRNGNRGGTLKSIRRLHSQIQENFSTSTSTSTKDSSLYRHWSEARQELVNTGMNIIETSFDQMGNQVIELTEPAKLERQQEQIDAARISIAEWLSSMPALPEITG